MLCTVCCADWLMDIKQLRATVVNLTLVPQRATQTVRIARRSGLPFLSCGCNRLSRCMIFQLSSCRSRAEVVPPGAMKSV